MFVLSVLRDVVRHAPEHFGNDRNKSISDEINRKFANKVVFNVGLCIALFDITSIGDEFIFPSDGGSHIQVEFRYIVFRPFVGQVLTGKIRSSTQVGIHVSMDFFDDIFITPDHLKPGTLFNTSEQVWIWHFEGNEARIEKHQEIRFKVVENIFTDIMPHSELQKFRDQTNEATREAPYTIKGSIDDDGLGLTCWWSS